MTQISKPIFAPKFKLSIAILVLLAAFALRIPHAQAQTDGVRNIYGWNTYNGAVSDPNSWYLLTDIIGTKSPVPETDDVAEIGSPDTSTITVTGSLKVALAAFGSSSGGYVNMNGAVTASESVETQNVTFLDSVTTAQVRAGDNTVFKAAVVADTNDDLNLRGLAFQVTSFTLANAPKFVAGSSLTASGALGFNLGGGSGRVSGLSFSGGATATVNQGTVPVNTGFTGSDLPASTAVFMLQNSALSLSDSGTQFTANGDLIVGIGFVGADLPAVINVTGGAKLVTKGTSSFGTFLPGDPNPPTNGKGTLAIDGSGSKWQTTGEIILGAASTADAAGAATGEITVSNGGALDATGQKIVLGQETGSEGALSVRNANSTGLSKDIIIGSLGTGTLLVEDTALLHDTGDAVVGEQSGSIGKATITGAGSKWQVDGDLIIGLAGDMTKTATGQVTVKDGATLTVNGALLTIGQETGSIGTLTIDGFGSKVTGSGATNVEIGRRGTGTLQLLNGGQFSIDSVTLGAFSGGDGIVKVDGMQSGTPSTFDTRGSLTIGGVASARGEVDITGGGQVIARNSAIIGRDPNSSGDVTLTGKDSTWNIAVGGMAGTGSLVIGQGGTGTLAVSDQANFTAASVVLGQNANSKGTMTMTGSSGTNDSKVTVNGPLTVGDGGMGTLTLSAASKLTTSGEVIVGNQLNSDGRIGLKDDGTTWTPSGTNLILGKFGHGELQLLNKAKLIGASSTLALGLVEGSSGLVTVSGAGTMLQVKTLGVGVAGDGTLTVVNGGTVIAEGLATGAVNGTGSILVDGQMGGTPSTLQIQQLSLGQGSAGLSPITITGGGQMIVAGQGPNAFIDLAANTVGRPDVVVSGTGSQLMVTAPNLNIGNDTKSGSVQISDGATVTANLVSISDPSNQSKVVVGGNAATTSSFIVSDLFVGKAKNLRGTLDIGAGGKVDVSSGVSVDGQITVHDQNARLMVGGPVGILLNSGSLAVSGGGNVSVASDMVVANSVLAADVTVANPGSQLSAATINVGGGTFGASGSLSTSDSGHVSIGSSLIVGTKSSVSTAAGGSIDIGPALFDQAPSGQIRVGAFGTLKDSGAVTGTVFNLGGKVGGSGTINGKLINGGTVAPGDPQTLTVNGDYQQLNGGVLQIAVAGTNASEFDHLNITGQLSLQNGSILEFDFMNGFAPKLGDKFDFLAYGTLDLTNSMFSQIQITGLQPGFEYTIAPDGVGSYGLVALNNGVSSTVPEPSAGTMLVLGAGLVLIQLRHKRPPKKTSSKP